jgi:hypothetical protein
MHEKDVSFPSCEQGGGHTSIVSKKPQTNAKLAVPILRDPERLKMEAPEKLWVCGTRTRQ